MVLNGCQLLEKEIFFFITLLALGTGLPQGAPESVCETMLPFHAGGSILPEKNVSPFIVETADSVIAQGETLKVEISGVPAGLNLGGFMVQARNWNPPFGIVGQFSSIKDGPVKLLNCDDSVNNSATHNNAGAKPQVIIEWRAPLDFLGQVVFNATVAEAYNKFWTGVVSNPIHVVKRDLFVETAQLPTTRLPSSTMKYFTTQAPYTPSEFISSNVVISSRMDVIYNDCGARKTCFGSPDGCIISKSCISITAVTVRGNIFEFELQSGKDSKAVYVAMGLSDDAKMGGDLVIECVPENGRVSLYSSYTSSSPYAAIRSNVFQNSAHLINASFVDGVIYCKVQRDPLITVQGRTFDLRNDKYHLLLASGTTLKDTGIGFHDIGRSPSGNRINLAVVQDLGGSKMVLVHLHGAFMITAWIGTASLGVIFARYFKHTWVGHQSCGKDQWFTWHRSLMVTTCLLTVFGLVSIWVELKQAVWHAHSILGLMTIILCFIQPIGAFFRPGPNDESRPCFNWFHWLVGNVCHTLAIVAIFFSVNLSKSELPEWTDWILVTFIVLHCLAHLIFSIAGAASDRQLNQRINAFQMGEMSHHQDAMRNGIIVATELDAPHAGLRKGLLGVYGIVVSFFVVVLILLVLLAPIEQYWSSS
ncbi:putative ferric-chelate reductase 1 homolog isoform X2 [Drosophila willistoni]|uniref:putative ferric-chelate reductase 1 homolog isoform X1 n=1 Tax=Drosophila willistoni TaxID=7260 RepID=UPI001F072180|nr:putative ferric-chelate reductase 1 homolog isoform X1 [Drosophila willistoni]XP_046868904.1 putative ferric-chelate reductase 1 homolog isoform X2 [Drosophila willistoni]